MSGPVVLIGLNIIAGLLVMLAVPLVWRRIGGAAGFLTGVVLIPLIWGAIIFGGTAGAQAIWGDEFDFTGIGQSATILFAMIAVVALYFGRRATKDRR